MKKEFKTHINLAGVFYERDEVDEFLESIKECKECTHHDDRVGFCNLLGIYGMKYCSQHSEIKK